MADTKQFTREAKEIFYQSKYDYFRKMGVWAVILSCLASTTYWVSDCQLFGRIAWETLLPRTFILLPLSVYVPLSRRITDYRLMVPFSYAILHGIMWCTIWAIYYLPIKQHANEGFIIMHLMFLAYGFCAPKRWSTFFHSLLIADILISYPFNRYESIGLMMTLGIPALVGIELILMILENTYAEQYSVKNELKRAMLHDQLTGAYNRNKMAELCEWGTNVLSVERAGVLLIDIDFFKRINDGFGHDAGDQVLVQLVGLIRDCIRESDIVVRWGGEEFVVLLFGCNKERSAYIAENIRKRVEEADNGLCRFTVSIGLAEYNGGDYHAAVKEADTALYYAKNHGRNQVSVY